ncbi:hypothetical protein C7C46_22220 [Streptomyces tateyamensis]|uniref:DUF3105 domain-containing protein n=1 Tax=Streptomyces tateyamensis TaxID=565073 RepID=A0A2V4NM40_9ACTN|nr:hypothetical protein [Streptomyces tateyamensis]PYC76688.1 hypothetical protein C7C46_22220 [Streptomyces tateyamensis]
MTTQGDSRSIPDGPAEIPGSVRNGARSGFTRARLIGWGGAVVLLGAGGFVVASPHPGDWLPGLGPSSKDKPVSVVGNPAPTSATDPVPFTVDGYFPVAKPVEVNAYKAHRSGGRQGNDCAETLRDPAKNVLKDSGCQAYLAVSFSRQDTRVLTSVTVLRFADEQQAAKAAALVNGQPGLFTFVLPDSSIAAPSAAPGGKPDLPTRVEAVERYLTITSSRFADGHQPAGADDPELSEATRAVSYTAGMSVFSWN